MAVRIMPVSDLRRKTRDVIEAARNEDAVVYLTRHGRPAIVLMEYARYERLMAQREDLSDRPLGVSLGRGTPFSAATRCLARGYPCATMGPFAPARGGGEAGGF